MDVSELERQLAEARKTIESLEREVADARLMDLGRERDLVRDLEEELVETNRGILALAVELEERNDEITRMSEQLWQTARLATMGEMTASIAHELNNPLQTVSLKVESLILDVPPEDPKLGALRIIQKEVDRMGGLVSNMLQFSRRVFPQASTLDIRKEIVATLELIRHRIRKLGISLDEDYSDDLPSIYADRQQIRQLFLNLFSNACDAMPGGGALAIRVYADPEDEAGDRGPGAKVYVEISDTGAGIPKENMPRVMEAFFSTKPEGEGTGLGLAICRRVMKESRGNIDIMSTPGEGTLIRLVFPVRSKSNSEHLESD